MYEKIALFITLKPHAKFFDTVKEALIQEIAPRIILADGLMTFAIHEDNNGAIILYEVWQNQELWQNFVNTDYMKAYFENMAKRLQNPPEIKQTRPILTRHVK